ncbi:DUF2388 domain-containing protein [Pseudomonas sp. Marseille-QA0892]
MIRTRTLPLLALLAVAHTAQASSFVATTDTIAHGLGESLKASTDISSSFRDNKQVLAARDDAASFVATSGEYRGARLEGALAHVRAMQPELQATDMELAEAILSL